MIMKNKSGRAIRILWRLFIGGGLLSTSCIMTTAAEPPRLFSAFGNRKAEKPAEESSREGRRFSKNREFILPFHLTETEKQQVAQVHLYVRGPAEAWRRHDSQEPLAGKFRFMVPVDGEYWFNIVTSDKQGRLSPPDVNTMAPALRVMVDTLAPVVQLTPQNHENAICALLACDDRHLDPALVKVEYQIEGKPWIEIKPASGQTRLYPLPSGGAVPCKVRAMATDMAGNVGMAELAIGMPPGSTSTATKPTTSDNELTPVAVMPNAPTTESGNSPRLVANPRTTIDYKIEGVGPSGISKIEIWLTNDGGKTWARKGEDSDLQSPATVDLPAEGVFGVVIHAVNGSGGGDPPPGPNHPADAWIELDSTRPQARIINVKPANNESGAGLDIAYTVSDKNLSRQAVTLLVSNRKGGPWTPLVQRAANDGMYHWQIPRHAGFEFYFRLEATDLAGNVGVSETEQPTRFDTSRPKGRVIQVRSESDGTRIPPENVPVVVPAAVSVPTPITAPITPPKMIDLPGFPPPTPPGQTPR